MIFILDEAFEKELQSAFNNYSMTINVAEKFISTYKSSIANLKFLLINYTRMLSDHTLSMGYLTFVVDSLSLLFAMSTSQAQL